MAPVAIKPVFGAPYFDVSILVKSLWVTRIETLTEHAAGREELLGPAHPVARNRIELRCRAGWMQPKFDGLSWKVG